MKFILEYKKYKPTYEVGDVVLIEYWYLNEEDCSPYLYKELPLTPVKIIEISKSKRKFKVSHNTPDSEIKNAPDEIVTPDKFLKSDKFKKVL
jgi:hypothetical protein